MIRQTDRHAWYFKLFEDCVIFHSKKDHYVWPQRKSLGGNKVKIQNVLLILF